MTTNMPTLYKLTDQGNPIYLIHHPESDTWSPSLVVYADNACLETCVDQFAERQRGGQCRIHTPARLNAQPGARTRPRPRRVWGFSRGERQPLPRMRRPHGDRGGVQQVSELRVLEVWVRAPTNRSRRSVLS